MRTIIVCDFDGTVTPVDSTDALLGRFAPPEWEDVEKEWLAGEITSRECMERQVAMIRAERQELEAFIDTLELMPGFKDFAEFCEQGRRDLWIVSDGIDHTIHRVLARHGLPNIPVIANHLGFTDNSPVKNGSIFLTPQFCRAVRSSDFQTSISLRIRQQAHSE